MTGLDTGFYRTSQEARSRPGLKAFVGRYPKARRKHAGR